MITKVRELAKPEVVFSSEKEAAEYCKNLLNYTIENEKEFFTFFGGKLLMCETEEFIILGKTKFMKENK